MEVCIKFWLFYEEKKTLHWDGILAIVDIWSHGETI